MKGKEQENGRKAADLMLKYMPRYAVHEVLRTMPASKFANAGLERLLDKYAEERDND